MKKYLLFCLFTLMMLPGLAWSNSQAESLVSSPLTAMDMGPMPLVSRSLAELSADEGGSVPTAIGTSGSAGLAAYGSPGRALSWLLEIFEVIVEPFYLSLLGASLLLFGTVKRRGH